jgi:hypothetical protein
MSRHSFLVHFMALGLFTASCASAAGSQTDGGVQQGNDAAACGTSSANSLCQSVTWPRVAVAFGDPASANLSYTFTANDGVTSGGGPCPSGYGESTALHCDIGFYGNPSETVVTVQVGSDEAGPPALSRSITLDPFNSCGNGIAQIVSTVNDAGVPELSAVQYINACGSL